MRPQEPPRTTPLAFFRPWATAALLTAAASCGSGEVRSQELEAEAEEPPVALEGMEEWAYLLGHTTPYESATEWDGDVNGVKTEWFKSGTKSGEGEYRDSRRVGAWTFWHENGQKRWEGTYVGGSPDGFERSWFENGHLEYEGTYADGLRDGECSHWRPNGRPLWTGSFRKGRRHGPFVQWETNGEPSISETGVYEDGTKVAKLTADEARTMSPGSQPADDVDRTSHADAPAEDGSGVASSRPN